MNYYLKTFVNEQFNLNPSLSKLAFIIVVKSIIVLFVRLTKPRITAAI